MSEIFFTIFLFSFWMLFNSNYRGFIKCLCRRSVGFFSRALLVFLMKESKKRRRKQPGNWWLSLSNSILGVVLESIVTVSQIMRLRSQLPSQNCTILKIFSLNCHNFYSTLRQLFAIKSVKGMQWKATTVGLSSLVVFVNKFLKEALAPKWLDSMPQNLQQLLPLYSFSLCHHGSSRIIHAKWTSWLKI